MARIARADFVGLHHADDHLRHGRPSGVLVSDGCSATGPAILAVNGDVMSDLLLRFNELFTEPAGLSPQHTYIHQIRLLPGTAPVAVRPYRYAYR
jgi:hypothetical protein